MLEPDTENFLAYSKENQILLAVFPSYSTYTLQLLDILTSFQKNTILKSFEATSIWLQEREAILKRFHLETPETLDRLDSLLSLNKADLRKIREVQNKLLHYENNRLREALTTKQRHKKKGKTLDLQQRKEYHGGAVFWLPRKLREARVRQSVREQEEKELQLQKAEAKELKAAATLYKQKIAEEKRVQRERAKVVKAQEKAKKAAQVA
ncbi:hypothetical protein K505DRAFT_354279 [Melanomma pulvis-pyrius CBS 109.77]|uniref:Uncharacterized protein n=1 Tax=Melanomma pulvis-pyrius CBS 109.77 TaxID=1314802 RepID=A0A6A6WRK3_9PLEO|nr:hypothetical protein K505DRAFT_354279 [Melanomma pulvis-pyrius CBS 109.77]